MTLSNDNGTDGQTDRQSATQYADPWREEGRIKTTEELGDSQPPTKAADPAKVLLFIVTAMPYHFCDMYSQQCISPNQIKYFIATFSFLMTDACLTSYFLIKGLHDVAENEEPSK